MAIKSIFSLCSLLLVCVVYFGSQKTATLIGAEQVNESQPSPINHDVPDQFEYLAQVDLKYKEVGQVLGISTDNASSSKSLLILYYHGISETANEEDVLWSNFRDQMHILKKNGYSTISMSDAKAFLLQGKPIPEKSFLLHFDDGRKDSYYPVDPILEDLGFNAVMFVITSTIAHPGNYHLTLKEYREMLESGRWELQSHGHLGHSSAEIDKLGGKDHWYTNLLWLKDLNRLETESEYRQRVRTDLQHSKEYLKVLFDIDPEYFAIPFGDYGQNGSNFKNAERIFLEELNREFTFQFYQPWDEDIDRNYPLDDSKLLRRVGVENDWTGEMLLHEIEIGNDKSIPFKDNLITDQGWKSTWGGVSVERNELHLHSQKETTGATAILRGTHLWNNYTIEVDAASTESTQSFSIIGAFVDDNNFVECQFSSFGIAHREKRDGELVTVKKWKTRAPIDLSVTNSYRMSLKNGMIGCEINTEAFESVASGMFLHNGLVGFSNWSKNKSEAGTTLTNISMF